jgi:hypothetical protein
MDPGVEFVRGGDSFPFTLEVPKATTPRDAAASSGVI